MTTVKIDLEAELASREKRRAEKLARVDAALERFGLNGRGFGDWDDILIAIDERLKRLEDMKSEGKPE